MTTESKKPAKKESAKAELARLAAANDDLKKKGGAKGKKVSTSIPAKKKPAKAKPVKVDEIIVAIVPAKGDIGEIMAKCVTTSKDNTALTLNADTTAEEYLRIFDNLTDYAEKFQLLIGDLIIQGEKLKAFGGKYAAAMAASGRSISTLKAYRATSFHTPKVLRLLPYSHLREVVKVEALEDKSRIIKDAAAKAKDGHMPSVQEIRKEADKCKTRKPKKKPAKPQKTAKVTRDLTSEENDTLIDLEDKASLLASAIEGASFALEAAKEKTITLREKLERIARFSAQLSE